MWDATPPHLSQSNHKIWFHLSFDIFNIQLLKLEHIEIKVLFGHVFSFDRRRIGYIQSLMDLTFFSIKKKKNTMIASSIIKLFVDEKYISIVLKMMRLFLFSSKSEATFFHGIETIYILITSTRILTPLEKGHLLYFCDQVVINIVL